MAVVAEVVECRAHNMPSGTYRTAKKPRLEARITDHRGYLTLTFFGQPRVITYWQNQLTPGARGIFAGKVREFNNQLQLAHPDFVIVDDEGRMVGGAQRNAAMTTAVSSPLIGLYPQTAKLRTWTIAECVRLALEGLDELPDPLPAWVREEAEVVELLPALRAVHAPATRPRSTTGASGCASTRPSPCS